MPPRVFPHHRITALSVLCSFPVFMKASPQSAHIMLAFPLPEAWAIPLVLKLGQQKQRIRGRVLIAPLVKAKPLIP